MIEKFASEDVMSFVSHHSFSNSRELLLMKVCLCSDICGTYCSKSTLSDAEERINSAQLNM